jgi:hypothetical protein
MSASGTATSSQHPATSQVRVNVLNVCTPSADEAERVVLGARVQGARQARPLARTIEVSRGHSTLDSNTPIPGMEPLPPGAVCGCRLGPGPARVPWRRRLFSNVQYSFSVDAKNMVETLVLRVRDPKDVMQIAIEDSASAVASAAAMLSASTPVARVKLERFGKSSVALARCGGNDGSPVTDQTAYEPIFRAAASIMERYRDALGARKMVPAELARLGVATPPKASSGKKKSP